MRHAFIAGLALFGSASVAACAAVPPSGDFARPAQGPMTIADYASAEFETKFISRGNNFPAVNVNQENRARLLFLAASGASAGEIRAQLGMDEAAFDARVQELIDAELLRRVDGELSPRVAVMTRDSVAAHMRVDPDLVAAAADFVIDAADDAQDVSAVAAPGFDASSVSLLVLSNVLLDNWQINAVERDVLHAERPLRAGARYYMALMQKADGAETEAFGIYGNNVSRYMSGVVVSIYGNNRTPKHNIINTSRQTLGLAENANREQRHARITELAYAYDELRRGGSPTVDLTPLKTLGWIGPGGELRAVVLAAGASGVFSDFAERFRPAYVELLGAELPALRAAYAASPFARQITFEEYFMWWYHLFYTAVTDTLIANGRIALPPGGNVSYIMFPSGDE